MTYVRIGLTNVIIGAKKVHKTQFKQKRNSSKEILKIIKPEPYGSNKFQIKWLFNLIYVQFNLLQLNINVHKSDDGCSGFGTSVQ